MKLKPFIFPIICFLLGMSFTIIGALFKIIHFEIGFLSGNILLSISTLFKLVAIVWAIVKLVEAYREP